MATSRLALKWARGISATPSYKLVKTAQELSRETVVSAIEGKNIDAVLVTRLAAIEEAEVFRKPANYDYERDYITYTDHVLRKSTPAYYDAYRVLTLETALFDTATAELVCKMQSEAIEASRSNNEIAELIDMTIRTLEKQKLIAPAP